MNRRRLKAFLIFNVLLACALAAVAALPATPTASAANTSRRVARQEPEVERISVDEFKAMLARRTPVAVVDVRGGGETKIKGALHIPLAEIETRLSEIPRDREVVTYCA